MSYAIPKYVEKAIDRLNKLGYEAFIVGGSVRDLLINKIPSDYDITTSAKPDEIIEAFEDYKTILTGVKFGTVTVIIDNNNVEITTYRLDDEYFDGRRPSKVSYTKSLEEDLSRRDFTINAMAYNRDKGVIDYFGGREDLDKKEVKAVGNPRKRFKEDHLRILRAIRFASQLNFTIEEETHKACMEMVGFLEDISMERIREEFFKILLSEKPSYGIGLMKELGVLQVILPELYQTVGFDQRNPHHDKELFDHTLCVVDKTEAIIGLRLAALFHDIGKPQTLTIDKEGIGHFYGHAKVGAEIVEEILTRLHCSRDLIVSVTTLVKEHMSHHDKIKEKGLKRLIGRVGEKEIFQLLNLQKADRICSSNDENIDYLLEREEEIKRVINSGEVYEKKQLDINGNDIINLGYKEGKIIGEILDFLMEEVLEEPELNNKKKLIERVKGEAKRWENYLEQME